MYEIDVFLCAAPTHVQTNGCTSNLFNTLTRPEIAHVPLILNNYKIIFGFAGTALFLRNTELRVRSFQGHSVWILEIQYIQEYSGHAFCLLTRRFGASVSLFVCLLLARAEQPIV